MKRSRNLSKVNNRIPLEFVAKSFAQAVRRRDKQMCICRWYTPCEGQSECSHYFGQTDYPALKFFPSNAWTMCHKHHVGYHQDVKDNAYISVRYYEFIRKEKPRELQWMFRHKKDKVKYTEALKGRIIDLCDNDKLDELEEMMREIIEGAHDASCNRH